ncbi:MAG: two-component system response regulator RppA [Cyanobacteria bacterium P01_A01_bin.17]
MHILLVDDEVELTKPLSRLLKREGYGVEVADNGETALKLIQDHEQQGHPYQLLILDWMLPHQSGLEICQQLRSQAITTPVLFLTAKDTLDDRVQGLDAGADDYLVKPFELRELLARVRALIRRNEQLAKSIEEDSTTQRIESEGLELDLESQVAYRGGLAIALSDKESRLLAYLMEHPQQLLTHEEIYQQLWPAGETPNSNVLAAQIRLLRRKLGSPKASALIHTIYGKGYWFSAAAP